MRRTTAAVLSLLAVGGLAVAAAPAYADDSPSTTTSTTAPPSGTPAARPAAAIHLSCEQADGKITCSWDAYDGAAGYRVIATHRRGRNGQIRVRKTKETSFTIDARPGHYNFVVQALDAHGKAIARSNRANVTVERSPKA